MKCRIRPEVFRFLLHLVVWPIVFIIIISTIAGLSYMIGTTMVHHEILLSLLKESITYSGPFSVYISLGGHFLGLVTLTLLVAFLLFIIWLAIHEAYEHREWEVRKELADTRPVDTKPIPFYKVLLYSIITCEKENK